MNQSFSSDRPLIPGYEILRVLGINLGTIYLARRTGAGDLVLLKVFARADADHARDLYSRLARLDHPNIVRVLETGDYDHSFYCVLEYVEGTLTERIHDLALSDGAMARLAGNVAAALEYARGQGMILRDIGPSAVLVTSDGEPKLLNFHTVEDNADELGAARASVYTSPESLPDLSVAADIFRIGGLIYFMMTGQQPAGIDGGASQSTVRNRLQQSRARTRQGNSHVRDALDAVCMRCLAFEPHSRYGSLRELTADLERVISIARAAGQ